MAVTSQPSTTCIDFLYCQGTTWAQEMVWMILNGCNIERAKQPLMLRSPFLEYFKHIIYHAQRLFNFFAVRVYIRMRYMVPPGVAPPKLDKMMIPLEKIETMPSPRVIKSHLPFHLLHPKLLDTSKVSRFFFQLLFFLFQNVALYRRWFMSPGILKMSLFLFFIITSWWNCIIILGILNNSPSTLWIMNVKTLFTKL